MTRVAHHISPLKLNEIPTNLQIGITVLKLPEETRKSSVNNQ
jgi:hypothetical protein